MSTDDQTEAAKDPVKDSEEYKNFEAVLTTAVRWVRFGIVCGIVGGITGTTALLIVCLR